MAIAQDWFFYGLAIPHTMWICNFFLHCFRKYQQKTKLNKWRLFQFAPEGLGLLCDRLNIFSFVLFHNKQ